MAKNDNASNGTQNPTSRKSHVILAMALIAAFAVITLFLATYLLLQLKFKEPIKITLSDWLKMIIPLVGSALVAIFAFLGVDRLKNFDDRQDKLAKELRAELTEKVNDSIKMVEPRLNDTYNAWNTDFGKKLASHTASMGRIEKRLKEYEELIGSVKELDDVAGAIGNVAEAHNYVKSRSFDQTSDIPDRAQRTRTFQIIVDRVQKSAIKGDAADYHNLAAEFARQNFFEFSCIITKMGADLFSNNIDLLSDYLYYSSKSGHIADVQSAMGRLDKINRTAWNWRAFTFYIDTLNAGETNEANKEKALECVKDYHSILPTEERAYMAEYETYLKYGDSDAAIRALETAEKELSMTAQCSLHLSEIYHMRGEYDKAIASATRAIIGQAEDQPSSNTGAAFAYRAFARDAKIHTAILDGHSADAQYDAIQTAIQDYTMAIELGFSQQNVSTRKDILLKLLPEDIQNQVSAADFQQRLENLERHTAKLTVALNALLEKLQDNIEDDG